MNKPILVNNQQEWERLAPVLEKQGYPMPHGFSYSDTPTLPTVVRLGAISWSGTDVHEWARPKDEKLISVDVYLLQPNWEAKYKAL